MIEHGLNANLVVRRDSGFTVDVDLAIPPAMTTALLGPSGAGKTTVVAALAGLVAIDVGRIALDGRILDDPVAGVFVPSEERHVGVVFQDYVLFPHLSALDNVSFGLRARGLSRREADARSLEWLERLDVAEFAGRRAAELSGGQAQRVALARALVTDPDLLLLDEPLSALDASSRVQLRRTLADHLEAFAGPRLLITHDPTEAFLLADRILVVEHGAITQTGTADEIRLRPRTEYIADLAGANLVRGSARDGIIEIAGHRLHVADHTVGGEVLATIHPRSIALHPNRPEGSARNVWETVVERIEHYGDRVRLQTGEPLPLTAEITPAALEALHLRRGTRTWVAIKATEIDVTAA